MSTLSAPTEGAPVLALLDNQQWNYLATPDDYPSGHGLDLDEMRRATQSRQLEIVGSLDLLQEVIGTARSNPTKYRRMVELFLEFVDRRILIPLSERHQAEVLHGAKLPDTDRYFS